MAICVEVVGITGGKRVPLGILKLAIPIIILLFVSLMIQLLSLIYVLLALVSRLFFSRILSDVAILIG